MTLVFVGTTNIIPSLGFSTSGHCRRIKAGQTGIRIHTDRNPALLLSPPVSYRYLEARVTFLGIP
jgi:hypothetical protein